MNDEQPTPELWEQQGYPLTVGELRRALLAVPDTLAVKLSLYDGTGVVSLADPVEVGLADSEPNVLVITGARL